MDDYGPLIQHDGAAPMPILRFSGPVKVQMYWSNESGRISPDEAPATMPGDWPGFYWRWKTERYGLFRLKTRRIRVCDNPDFHPIVAYRIKRGTDQVEALRHIAQDINAPITGPEHTTKPIKEITK